jgi:hypothetical protein
MPMRIAGPLILSGAAALGACAAQPGGPAASAMADDGPVVCREVLEPPSNVLRRYCMTPAQWAAYQRDREYVVDEYMRRVQTEGGVGGF